MSYKYTKPFSKGVYNALKLAFMNKFNTKDLPTVSQLVEFSKTVNIEHFPLKIVDSETNLRLGIKR